MSGAAEPIAVIGVGCRLPGGAESPESFWDLLTGQRETSGPAPVRRWEWYREVSPEHDLAVQRTVSRGSFLDDVEGFDAAFFGMSGREAEEMDPQQRILLETGWEALEHAGVPPHSLRGSETGVYVGFCTGDYGRRLLEDLPGIEAWTGIGAANCALADRISYVLDLRGPSLAVDTACSASLVSLHLACQGLRAGDCTTALAAGVNLIVSPGETLSLAEAGALSPDGRSRPFDADADGYGRGEGCGVLVLRRLSDARRAGDRVLAVVAGSGVNQDGRTDGIMAPSGSAQEHMMRRACANAGIDPATVDLVEAHGTGTRLGDPEEAEALGVVYGAGRAPGEPCLVGSVKGNIGHLEGAAGVAGLIKVILALHRAAIPPSLVGRLNPEIPWGRNGLRVATETAPWPVREHPRRAAVSGFGYGGSIAHVVLEQAPDHAPGAPDEPDGPRLYPLSAASPEALAASAG
ncbi:type I polyketide synthase, partial [Saccharomonospora halophila]|uniref:type I polyketide synthase n=1 Tax=Saccharomonospora halophila TaxID=129922 RepID=UPI00048F6F68